MNGKASRRAVLRSAMLTGAASLLAACGTAMVPTETMEEKPAEKPAPRGSARP